MANVAASGGYWVSTPANRIFAEPETITGSIGVFGILPSFDQALAKIGVNADGIATTPLSGQPDIFGGVNDEFNALARSEEHTSELQSLMRISYAVFCLKKKNHIK